MLPRGRGPYEGQATIVLVVVLTIAAVGQIILPFLLYNRQDHPVLRYVGWAVLVVWAILGWLPLYTFRTKGGVAEGRGCVHSWDGAVDALHKS